MANKTYLVAELSANHGHKLENALALVRVAKSAGADAIKIQTYTADTMTLDCDNVRSVRPGYGLHPKYFTEILGKRLNRDLKKCMRMDIMYIEP